MDKLELMMEADRRGILPPEKKALLDEAVRRGLVGSSGQTQQQPKADKPLSVSVGETLREIPRQIGLTARYGMEGLGDAAGIVTEPIRAVINPALRAAGAPGAQSTRSLMTGLADAAGLPSPQGANEQVIADATRMVAGVGGISSAARGAANLVTGPGAKTVMQSLSSNVGQQAAGAAGAGAAGGAVREAGGGAGEQFVASLAGGVSAAGLSQVAVNAYNNIANAVQRVLTPKNSMTEINVVLNQILNQNGVDVSKLPGMMRSELAHEVKLALDTGRQINPDVVRRIADYGLVGATPTKGTVTLDPVQITREKNLAKLGANSTDPRLQELSQVQNANNARLIENMNELGANTPNANPVIAGQQGVGAIQARDAAARAKETALYAKARDSQGRAIDLDREGFIFDAYNRLGESNKSAFLPDNIKSLLQQIHTGKVTLLDGTERAVPFNVDVIDSLKTTLATASRSAADGNVRAAISQVRNALEAAQPKAVGRTVGGNQLVDPKGLTAAQGAADDISAESMKAFDRARRFAKARRDWQESSPGIAAALEDVAPDRFVKDYVLANGNKAAAAEVEKMIFTLRKDPTALQAVKENVVSYFKSKALGGVADEVGSFSPSGFNNALREFGDMKLKLFFTADEIAQLKALGRVSSYETVQPRGSAVNNSNTAGAFTAVLDKIASNQMLGRIPFGDSALRGPARNWSTQMGINNAKDAYGDVSQAIPRERPALTIKELLGPGLLLTAPRVEGSNKDKGN